jgi:hypothetical protein
MRGHSAEGLPAGLRLTDKDNESTYILLKIEDPERSSRPSEVRANLGYAAIARHSKRYAGVVVIWRMASGGRPRSPAGHC